MGVEHVPVMVKEVISYMNLKDGGFYLDGTLGLGGHSIAMLKEKRGRINILGLDMDAKSLEIARERIKTEGFESSVVLANVRFSEFGMVLKRVGWDGLEKSDFGRPAGKRDGGRGLRFREGPGPSLRGDFQKRELL